MSQTAILSPNGKWLIVIEKALAPALKLPASLDARADANSRRLKARSDPQSLLFPGNCRPEHFKPCITILFGVRWILLLKFHHHLSEGADRSTHKFLGHIPNKELRGRIAAQLLDLYEGADPAALDASVSPAHFSI